MTDGGTSIPEVQRLLAVLVAAKPGGRVAELGTAFGVAAEAMLAELGPGSSFVTVELDPERFEIACERLAGTRAEVILGDWREVLADRGPFDLIFLDAGNAGETAASAISLLADGGILVKDDLSPGVAVEGDPTREALFGDPRVVCVEIQTTPEMAAIIAVLRGD